MDFLDEKGDLMSLPRRIRDNDLTVVALTIAYKRISVPLLTDICSAIPGNSIVTSLSLPGSLVDIPSEAACALISAALSENSFITSLSLSSNTLDIPSIRQIADLACKTKCALHTLDLSSCSNVEGIVFNCLTESMMVTSFHLKNLNLTSNRLSVESCDAFMTALSQNTTIEILNLMACLHGDEMAQSVSRMLAQNSTLTSLGLSHCRLEDSGSVPIAESLSANSSLRVLNLKHVMIGTAGTVALGRSLEHNASLQVLILATNTISEDGCYALAAAIRVNSSLRELNLQCSLSEVGVDAIVEALDGNHSLISLPIFAPQQTQQQAVKMIVERNILLEDQYIMK